MAKKNNKNNKPKNKPKKKTGFNKRRKGPKCPVCNGIFTSQKYLTIHQKSNCGCNNNNNIIKKNENILKKFIKFIIKIVFLINEQIEIKNFIGDKYDQRRAQYIYNNNDNNDNNNNNLIQINDYEWIIPKVPKPPIANLITKKIEEKAIEVRQKGENVSEIDEESNSEKLEKEYIKDNNEIYKEYNEWGKKIEEKLNKINKKNENEIKNEIKDEIKEIKSKINTIKNKIENIENIEKKTKTEETILYRYNLIYSALLKEKAKIGDKLIENKINEEKEEELYNYLNKLEEKKDKDKKNFKYKLTKIKYNDMIKIKNLNKELLINNLIHAYGPEIKNEDIQLEILGDLEFTKISIIQLFKEVVPNSLKKYNKIKNYIIKRLDKLNKKDYPEDEKIKDNNYLWEEILKKRSKHNFYGDNFNKIKQMIKNFFNNEINEYQCEYCENFILNKKKHCLKCPQFIKKYKEEGDKIIIKFIRENYKIINPLNEQKIFEKIKEKDIHWVCHNLPIIIKPIKKIEKKEEKINNFKIKIIEIKKEINETAERMRELENEETEEAEEELKELDKKYKELLLEKKRIGEELKKSKELGTEKIKKIIEEIFNQN